MERRSALSQRHKKNKRREMIEKQRATLAVLGSNLSVCYSASPLRGKKGERTRGSRKRKIRANHCARGGEAKRRTTRPEPSEKSTILTSRCNHSYTSTPINLNFGYKLDMLIIVTPTTLTNLHNLRTLFSGSNKISKRTKNNQSFLCTMSDKFKGHRQGRKSLIQIRFYRFLYTCFELELKLNTLYAGCLLECSGKQCGLGIILPWNNVDLEQQLVEQQAFEQHPVEDDYLNPFEQHPFEDDYLNPFEQHPFEDDYLNHFEQIEPLLFEPKPTMIAETSSSGNEQCSYEQSPVEEHTETNLMNNLLLRSILNKSVCCGNLHLNLRCISIYVSNVHLLLIEQVCMLWEFTFKLSTWGLRLSTLCLFPKYSDMKLTKEPLNEQLPFEPPFEQFEITMVEKTLCGKAQLNLEPASSSGTINGKNDKKNKPDMIIYMTDLYWKCCVKYDLLCVDKKQMKKIHVCIYLSLISSRTRNSTRKYMSYCLIILWWRISGWVYLTAIYFQCLQTGISRLGFLLCIINVYPDRRMNDNIPRSIIFNRQDKMKSWQKAELNMVGQWFWSCLGKWRKKAKEGCGWCTNKHMPNKLEEWLLKMGDKMKAYYWNKEH